MRDSMPTIAPTAVIEVDAGTPWRFEIRRARPEKKRTTTLVAGVNTAASTIWLLIVEMTFRPIVHAPRNAKTVNSAPAVTFLTIRLPTAGPNATPVEDPPIL